MQKVFRTGVVVTGVPYFVAFAAVCLVALVLGKIPSRLNKLALLPWLDFLCGLVTIFAAIGLLHLLRVPPSVWVPCGCGIWMVVFLRGSQKFAEIVRSLAGLCLGWELYRFF